MKTPHSTKLEGYTFHAAALAAHFKFATNSEDDFGPEYTLGFRGQTQFKHHQKAKKHDHRGFSFAGGFVHVSAKQRRGGVYETIARASLKNYQVKGKLTADRLECGVMTVYREEWYSDPARPKRARILPLPPVIEGLKICGQPFRLGKELELPEPFRFSDARRKQYFLGDEPEIEPVGISPAPGRRLPTKDCGEIEISEDTRRITVPGFGIVNIADWMWLPPDIHTAPQTAQWVQLIGLELKNPGNGGGSGAGGNGTPHGG